MTIVHRRVPVRNVFPHIGSTITDDELRPYVQRQYRDLAAATHRVGAEPATIQALQDAVVELQREVAL